MKLECIHEIEEEVVNLLFLDMLKIGRFTSTNVLDE